MKKPISTSLSKQRGFSLAETAAVLVVSAIALGVAMNAFGTIKEGGDVEAAKKEISYILNTAKLKSYSDGQIQKVEFDWVNESVKSSFGDYSTYYLVDLKGYSCSGSALVEQNDTTRSFFYLRNGVSHSSQGERNQTPYWITISSNITDQVETIKINPFTGLVKTVEGEIRC